MLTPPIVFLLGLALSAQPVDWKRILAPRCTVRQGTDTKEGRIFVVQCPSEPQSRLYLLDRSAENGAIEIDRSSALYGHFVPTDDLLYFSTWGDGRETNWQGRIWDGKLSKRPCDVPGRIVAVMSRFIFSTAYIDAAIGLYATSVDGGRPRLIQATPGARYPVHLVQRRYGGLVLAVSVEGHRYRNSKLDRGPVALQLWSTDGQDSLPIPPLIRDRDEVSDLEDSVVAGGRLYTPAAGRNALHWGVTVTDGDRRWWLSFVDEEPAPKSIDHLVPVGDGVFVLQRRYVHTLELWHSRDGRQASLAAEIPIRESNGFWGPPTVLRHFSGCGKLWVVVNGREGPQLWMSDGTREGTRRVLNTEAIGAGLGEPLAVELQECIDGTLILERVARQGRSLETRSAATGHFGSEIWRTEEPR